MRSNVLVCGVTLALALAASSESARAATFTITNINNSGPGSLRQAADREDATEKHPVTPGSIQPAREMLAELLLDLGQPAPALKEFEASQRTDPNHLHGLAGAPRAAELPGDRAKAKTYYTQLVDLTKTVDTDRPEIAKAKAFLAKN